jgi:hypothetical protein
VIEPLRGEIDCITGGLIWREMLIMLTTPMIYKNEVDALIFVSNNVSFKELY